MSKIKIMITAMAVGMMALLGAFIVQPVSAVKCPTGSLRAGKEVSNLAECNVEETKEDDSLMKRVQVIINVILSVLGIVTVIMIILGGVQYTTSAGDPAKVTKAKNTIMYGVIGLVIALLAFAIVNFVLANVFNGGSEEKKDDEVKASVVFQLIA